MEKPTLERITSPEDLDRRLVVVSSKGWIALGLTFLLLVGAILWSFFGLIPNTFETRTIYLNKQGFEIINSQFAGKVTEVIAETNHSVSAGDVLMLIEQPSGEISKILSNTQGKVIEILSVRGTSIHVGDPLFMIQKEQGEFDFFSFVPIERGQQLKKGMSVYIKPDGVDVQQYGSIEAVILSISPFVASQGELQRLLGSSSLIPHFTNNQPVVIITIKPQKDPQTKSGLKWTSGFGPPFKIMPQTIGNALIVLESRHPISYAIPLWRFKKITHEINQQP